VTRAVTAGGHDFLGVASGVVVAPVV
jgi:hypothetical protein